MSGVARVLIDSPLPQLDQLFDYQIPDRLADRTKPGVRVKVPLRVGGRIADGWLVAIVAESTYTGRLSELADVVGDVPLLASEVWKLARAVADRAAGNASDILRLAIPQRYVRVEKSWLATTSDPGKLPAAGAITGYPTDQVVAGLSAGARMALQADPRLVDLGAEGWVGSWAVTLAELAVNTLASDRSALIVLPDYRDQEQVTRALRSRVDSKRVLRADARQPGGERYHAFLEATAGAARIIVGNRSTIYSPAARLGLIAFRDDADPLQNEPHAPGVHPRDAALIRQEQSGAALVFLGHSRSVEVERLIQVGWVQNVSSVGHTRPKVILTRQQSDAGGLRIPSTAWRRSQEEVKLGPVLVQVSRPGHTPALACAQCREPAHCLNCGGQLAIPRDGGAAACNLCGAANPSWKCGTCGANRFRAMTVGASRTAEELGRAFPQARVLLSDGENPILQIGAEPALVVATRGAEPVADGGYRAVLLLDGERMLLRESLRVAEECMRWWANAAALAAPNAPVFLVGVDGTIAKALAGWRLTEWVATELDARRALRFPPATRLASVSGTAARIADVIAEVREIPGVDVLGPTPASDGVERAVVRFDYAHGAAVAGALKAAVIRAATERSRPIAGRRSVRSQLRVRFDDPSLL